MDVRLDMFANPVTSKFLKRVSAAARVYMDSSLPSTTRELVALRISQINGCAFCIDMHTKEATHEGETPARLHLVAAWREATVFTEPERAALALAEEGTRVADAAGGVPDDVWAHAAKHHDEDQLAALVSLIAFMNTVNRMNIITQQPGGEYRVGWLDEA